MMQRLLLALLFALAVPTQAFALDGGRFQQLRVGVPSQAQPVGLVFVISDTNGWTTVQDEAAAALQADGWLTVGLDLALYRASLKKSSDSCHDVGDELIDLAQRLQRERNLSQYLTPVLVGYGQGGTLAYAAIKQALPASFDGGLAIMANPADNGMLGLPQALCDGPKLQQRAVKTQGGANPEWRYPLTDKLNAPFQQVAQSPATKPAELIRKYARAAADGSISDLPLVSLPADVPSRDYGDLLVVFMSGDGGWRDIDKTISEELHRHGVSIVGIDSLRYFWHAKQPEEVARDIGDVVAYYKHAWRKSRVALIGYSFGADAIPFVYNRLTQQQGSIDRLGLLSLGKAGSFEIEVEGYIGLDSADDLPLAPELAKLSGPKVLCVYGADDADDSSCPLLHGKSDTEAYEVPGDHHFDENYVLVSEKVLSFLK